MPHWVKGDSKGRWHCDCVRRARTKSRSGKCRRARFRYVRLMSPGMRERHSTTGTGFNSPRIAIRRWIRRAAVCSDPRPAAACTENSENVGPPFVRLAEGNSGTIILRCSVGVAACQREEAFSNRPVSRDPRFLAPLWGPSASVGPTLVVLGQGRKFREL